MLNKLQRFLPFSGLLGVLVLWVGTIAGMQRAGLSLFDHRPISYLGVNAGSAALFSVTLLVSAVLFCVFCFYLRSVLKLPRRFIYTFIIGQLGQMIAAVVPYGGASKLIHTYAAFTLAFAIPLHMYFFAKATAKTDLKYAAQLLFRLELVFFVIGIGSFVLIKKVAPLTEALPALPFHAWLIAVGLRLHKKPSHLFIKMKNGS